MQVALLPNAVSSDSTGQAAAVTTSAGNKARIKKGSGTFKDIQLAADLPGSYILRAKPSSREVELQTALSLQVLSHNKGHQEAWSP